ncbi:MAG TPA: hypothetical protein DEW35_03285 [Ruminococcaceae bacterium]|nr:hypothetical protein [Oscillospiraceae bacterium]
MKINKIYISAFGGIKDLNLDLGDGLNVIFGENEQGKTTVMSFIRAMFYGTGKKTQNLGASLRVKYTPLDGTPMGGRIYFEQNGNEYCLERIFNKSDSTDKITLTDISTGEKTPVTNEIGNRVFGIGAEAFKKSLFISCERNFEPDDIANGDLSARLSAVALTGNEDTSFQKIEKRITSAKEKVLSKTERAGILARLRNERAELQKNYEKAKDDAIRKSELTRAIEEYEKTITAHSLRGRAIKKLLSKKEDVKNAEKLKNYLRYKEKLDSLSADLTTPGGHPVDTAFISGIKFCKAKLAPQSKLVLSLKKELETMEKAEEISGAMTTEQAEQRKVSLSNDISSAEGEKAKIGDDVKNAEQCLKEKELLLAETENHKKAFNPILLVLGLVIITGGAVLGATLGAPYYAVAVLGAIISVLSFIFKPDNKAEAVKIKDEIAEIKTKIATLKTRESEISAMISNLTNEMNTVITILTADKTLKEKRLADIAAKKAQINAETEKEQELLLEYQKALDGLSDTDEDLEKIEKKAEEQKEIRLNLGYLSKDLGGISYEEAKERLASNDAEQELSKYDFEAAEAEFDRLSEQIIEENAKKTSFETELKTSFRNSLQPEVVEREIKMLDEKIAEMEDFVSGCEISLNVLSESFASIRKGYGAELNRKTLQIFSALTNGKYKTVNVNKSLQIEVEKSDSFGMFESGYLSTGTEDQAFLALRLAISEMIGDKESYPVFLDDALSNYDDTRTETAIDFLKEYAKKAQVILFTCHGKVSELAENNGTVVKSLK